MFQSTHPHGVRPQSGGSLSSPGGFNPRTRTGCDMIPRWWTSGTRVSIHAPARGATSNSGRTSHDSVVSIHAPARGATMLMVYTTNSALFQSTHPHGVRQSIPNMASLINLVSIHAPARGATLSFFLISPSQFLFQSTHPHGVRRFWKCQTVRAAWFQSTHPHGVRQTGILHLK